MGVFLSYRLIWKQISNSESFFSNPLYPTIVLFKSVYRYWGNNFFDITLQISLRFASLHFKWRKWNIRNKGKKYKNIFLLKLFCCLSEFFQGLRFIIDTIHYTVWENLNQEVVLDFHSPAINLGSLCYFKLTTSPRLLWFQRTSLLLYSNNHSLSLPKFT